MSAIAFNEIMAAKLLESRAITLTGCWLWTGALTSHGYGATNFERRQIRAHQAAFRIWSGEVPPGLQLDHTCRTRECFNPKHLECVTPRENSIRGQAVKTHCPQGHAYDKTNTYVTPKGHRDCRACRAAAGKRRNQRERS